MTGAGSTQVVRTRLIERLSAQPVALVEAGAGFGKSVLASQYGQSLGIATVYVPLGVPDRDPGFLIGSLRRSLAGARLSDLLAATADAEPVAWIERLLDALGQSEDPVLVVLDDAHHLQSAEAAGLLLRLARGLPAPHRLLVAARSFARQLEPVWTVADAGHLDTQELAFTFAEASQLLALRGLTAGARQVEVVLEATEGWATALVLATAGGSLDGRESLDGGQDPVGTPLRGIVQALAPSDRTLAVQLAHLPFFSVALCDDIAGGDGAFERLVAGGVPLARAATGWWELPSPVAAHLAGYGPIDSRTVRAAARAYWQAGAEVAALRVLVDGGASGEAAAAVDALDPTRLEDLGLEVVRDVVESLPEPDVKAHPRVLLHVARLAETAHQNELRTQSLARATDVLAVGDDAGLQREVDAERARDLMWDERTREESRALAESVVAGAGPDELVARARALDVLGRLGSWFSRSGPQPEAEGLLRESARLARRLGQPTWTAQALVALGAGFFFALCRHEEAINVLDQALEELPVRNRYRAMIHSFRVDTLVELARWEEAEEAIGLMREIGAAVREQWILAYAAWGEASLASYQGDGARTARAYREIDRHRDEWFEQPSGGECLAQVADHLSRAGEHELALECLARARRRMEGNERIVRVHGAAVLARSGEPDEAEAAIAEALRGAAAEPHELWPLHLQRAYVAARRDDPQAGALAVAAFEMCREIGHPLGPLVRERTLSAVLLPLAIEAGSPAAAALAARQDQDGWAIRLLGGFEVRRGGVRVELPPGRPARAVRAVAVGGGRLHAEGLIELLWPEVSPDVGRERLRNLLSRLRLAAGEVLRRDGDTIALAAGCEVDAASFEMTGEAALAASAAGDRRRAVRLARAALERYRGELLPDDRYEAWAEERRGRLRVLRLELLDLTSAAAEEDGDIDHARRLIMRAIEVEPRDERRYLQLARLLASQGRRGSALVVLERARAVFRAEGFGVSPELERLARSIADGGGRA